jgi:hypothetical protein
MPAKALHMTTEPSKKHWPYLAGGLLVAVIVAVTLLRHTSGDVQTPSGTTTPKAPASDAAMNNAMPAAAVPTTAMPAPAAHPAAISYERADNLLAIAQSNAGKSDAAALGLRARALQECRALADTPDYFANIDIEGPKLHGDKFPIVRHLVDTYLQRCSDLAHIASAAETQAAIEDAAKAGNTWAQATLLPQQSRGLPSAEVDARLQHILASRDADAIDALAADMTNQRTVSAYSDLAGSPLATYAWQLASCDLGRDCTANGQLMREACLFGGQCGSATDFRTLLKDSVLSEDELNRVELVKQAILDTIRTGKH